MSQALARGLSARAFYPRIHQRSGPKQTCAREGARTAYPEHPWYWELTVQTPRHGCHPFEIVHIDHTELDIEIRSSSTGELLGKPWATFMMDVYSRRLLAVYLTFDPPSYRSVMLENSMGRSVSAACRSTFRAICCNGKRIVWSFSPPWSRCWKRCRCAVMEKPSLDHIGCISTRAVSGS